ncbi:MAG: DUF998 domain-containing protein [Lactococcus cremoris]
MRKSNYLVALATCAALLYNAWILAFWLNPSVVNSSLLSGLSALNQPYHQLFTLTDILSGSFCFLLALGIFMTNKKEDKRLLMILTSIAGFGITTALAALFPYADLTHSEGIPNPLREPKLFIHDGLSVLALLFILFGVVISLLVYRNFFLLILVITFVITTLLSFVAGAIPQLVGPLGQQINALLGGIWLVFISWRVLNDSSQATHVEN